MEQQMKQQIKQKKTVAGFAIFLLMMWVCTLISKSVYASQLPQVTVSAPEKKSIEHVVEAEGIVKQGNDVAIHTLSGLRVEKIYTRVGDIVEKDSVLFQLDMEDLEEIIEAKKLEAAKLEYKIADLQNNKELTLQDKQKQENRAKEDYGSAENKSEITVNRAAEERNQAEEKLKKHLENGVSVTSDEDRQKAYGSYEEWLNQGRQLEENLAGRQTKMTEMEQKTAEAEAKVLLAEEKVAGLEGSAAEDMETAEAENTEPETAGAEAAEAEQGATGAELEAAKAELEAARAELEAVRVELETAESELAAVLGEMNTYKENPMSQPDFTGEDSAKKAWEGSKEALQENIQEAHYSQEDAAIEKQDTLTEAERKIEDAMAAEQADSTLQIYRMELEQLQKNIEKYRKIYKNDGNVESGLAGTITELHIITGEKTPDGAAVVCADSAVPYQLEISLTKEQKKYIDQGDIISIKTGKGRAEELKVDYIAEEESNPGSYRAVVYLPEGVGTLGMSAALKKSDLSESYECCIPIEALHSENNGLRYFVYVAGEREGILGTELYVELRNVAVLDKNEKYAALEQGAIAEDEALIIGSDKPIEENAVIRYKE